MTIAATSFKAMEGFADVREVKLPNKWNNGSEDVDVTSIGNSAFFRCIGLTSVTIPDSVTSIGDEAFRGCSSLTSVEFEGNAPAVSTHAFSLVASGCKAIISSTATGFDVDFQRKWNGLIVEVKS